MNRCRCWIHTLAWVVIIVAVLVPMGTWAQESSPLTPEQARRAALERMQIEVDASYVPSWVDAVLSDPITLYDLSDAVSGYLFPVTRFGEPTGYLTVAAPDIPNPVLEFSVATEPPLWTRRSMAEAVAHSEGMTLCTERPLYVGPLSYGFELALQGECANIQNVPIHRVVDLFDGTVIVVNDEQARIPLADWIGTVMPVEITAPVIPSTYKLISGVPDYCQFYAAGCWSGCTPTASANALGYWDAHGYSNLQSGGNWQQLVLDLGSHMSTNCGATNIGNVSPGIVNYAQTRVTTLSQCYIGPTLPTVSSAAKSILIAPSSWISLMP
jgi:hypothetical protein